MNEEQEQQPNEIAEEETSPLYRLLNAIGEDMLLVLSTNYFQGLLPNGLIDHLSFDHSPEVEQAEFRFFVEENFEPDRAEYIISLYDTVVELLRNVSDSDSDDNRPVTEEQNRRRRAHRRRPRSADGLRRAMRRYMNRIRNASLRLAR